MTISKKILTTKTTLDKIKQEIINNKNNKQTQFAVFDFDNTCIKNDIEEAVIAHMTKHNLIRDKTLTSKGTSKSVFLKYYELIELSKQKNITKKESLKIINKAYKLGSKIISGFTDDKIKKIVLNTIKEEGNSITKRTLFGIKINKGLKIRKEIIELMTFLNKNKIKIFVVSATSEPIVKTAVKELFPLVDKCIGIKYEKDKNKQYTSKMIKPITYLLGKVKNIKIYFGNDQPLIGIGDSIGDLAMLKYSKIRVVVNRKNELSDYAKTKGEKNNWFIIN